MSRKPDIHAPTPPLPPEKAAEEIRLGHDLGVEWLVPKEYSRPETSPLTAEVKRGNNTVDFDIPSS